MQIYRIKTGQFWYHVRVENEPVHAKYKQNLSNIDYHEKKSNAEMAKKEKREASLKKSSSKKTQGKKAKSSKKKKK